MNTAATSAAVGGNAVAESGEQIPTLSKAQLRAQQKAATKARKLEAARLKELERKRDELRREEGYGQTTYDRAATDWMNLMTDVSHKEAKNELQALWGELQQMLDVKENLVEELEESLQHFKNQFQCMSESHLKDFNHAMSTC